MAKAGGLDSICESATVAPPGFINLTLSADFLARELREMASDPSSLGVGGSSRPEVVVVDYAAPNAAKQMHVGHLRSTIIGDSLVRLLDMVGHKVVRENHIGDWGAPFGMLIEHLLDVGEDQAIGARALGDLEAFYQAARAAYDSDPGFAERGAHGWCFYSRATPRRCVCGTCSSTRASVISMRPLGVSARNLPATT